MTKLSNYGLENESTMDGEASIVVRDMGDEVIILLTLMPCLDKKLGWTP